jgi:hypothetical protein
MGAGSTMGALAEKQATTGECSCFHQRDHYVIRLPAIRAI